MMSPLKARGTWKSITLLLVLSLHVCFPLSSSVGSLQQQQQQQQQQLQLQPPTHGTNMTPSNLVGAPQTSPSPNYLETGRQITNILNRFMNLGYDKRVRPNYGGPPVEVNVTMRILSISSVSEVMMDFTADFYFRQTWHDPRLSFKKLGDIQTLYVGAEVSKKIWLPDTFFGNEKMAYFHEATTPNVFLRIDHSGEVYRSIRLTVTSSCPMNLQYFPMDRQRCTIEAESYGYNVKDIIYRWARKNTAVERDEGISLPQFDIVQTLQKYRLEELSSGTYSRLIAEIHFTRRMGYYLIQIYIPSSLIVVISWVSFWLHRNASPARVQLGVTTVLTMTTLMSSTNAALPKISYVKSIDIFLGTCFVMVFAALLEYATVGYLGKRIAMRKAHAQHAQAQTQARLCAQLQQAAAAAVAASNGKQAATTANAAAAAAAAAQHLSAAAAMPTGATDGHLAAPGQASGNLGLFGNNVEQTTADTVPSSADLNNGVAGSALLSAQTLPGAFAAFFNATDPSLLSQKPISSSSDALVSQQQQLLAAQAPTAGSTGHSHHHHHHHHLLHTHNSKPLKSQPDQQRRIQQQPGSVSLACANHPPIEAPWPDCRLDCGRHVADHDENRTRGGFDDDEISCNACEKRNKSVIAHHPSRHHFPICIQQHQSRKPARNTYCLCRDQRASSPPPPPPPLPPTQLQAATNCLHHPHHQPRTVAHSCHQVHCGFHDQDWVDDLHGPQAPPRRIQPHQQKQQKSLSNLISRQKHENSCQCQSNEDQQCGPVNSQTLPRNLTFAQQNKHQSVAALQSSPNPAKAPACCGPRRLPLPVSVEASSFNQTSSPIKGASAVAAAAAATFVNLHRRNKGLPPSTNPNFAQFSSPLSSPYNRHLETIFGIRPSDIDKYSRVVFPVCFVCFQLMYWIVYLRISAFLEPEIQHQQQQAQSQQPTPLPAFNQQLASTMSTNGQPVL